LRSTVLTRIAAITTATALVMGGFFTDTASARATGPELVVSAAFERPSYDSAEPVAATITVRNTGDLAATGVTADVVRGVSNFRPAPVD